MVDAELDALLQEADTAIQSCQLLQEARKRVAELETYIPQFASKIERLAEVDPEGGVIGKLRKKLAELTSERSELMAVINPEKSERKKVGVVASKVSLTDAVNSVEADREERKQEYADRLKNAKTLLESVGKFRFELAKVDTGESDATTFRELVEQALYLSGGAILEIEEFITMLKPYALHLASGKAFKELRKKLREEGVDFEKDEKGDDEPDVAGESDDTLHEKMEGKTVAFLGGDRIGAQLDKYKDHFKFAEIVWTSATKNAEVSSMAKQVESGNIEVVFCIVDFCGHSQEAQVRAACKKAGIPFIRVHGGYGLSNFAQSYMRQQGVSV